MGRPGSESEALFFPPTMAQSVKARFTQPLETLVSSEWGNCLFIQG